MENQFNIPELCGSTAIEFSIEDETKLHHFILDNGRISVSCLWRLISEGKILGTRNDVNFDHWMNHFKDPSDILSQYLIGKKITVAYAFNKKGDLVIEFDSGAKLEVIKDHCALECWELFTNNGLHLLTDAWGEINGWDNSST